MMMTSRSSRRLGGVAEFSERHPHATSMKFSRTDGIDSQRPTTSDHTALQSRHIIVIANDMIVAFTCIHRLTVTTFTRCATKTLVWTKLKKLLEAPHS